MGAGEENVVGKGEGRTGFLILKVWDCYFMPEWDARYMYVQFYFHLRLLHVHVHVRALRFSLLLRL
jgi:hypothetical protein